MTKEAFTEAMLQAKQASGVSYQQIADHEAKAV
jgi:cyanate lyase